MRGAEEVASDLANHLRALAEARIVHAWHYSAAYYASEQTSVAGRNRDAERATLELQADIWRIEAEVEICKVLLHAA